MTLFKIITVKDEVVIGLSADELSAMGGNDAGTVAKALAAKGTLTVWQYATRTTKAFPGNALTLPANGPILACIRPCGRLSPAPGAAVIQGTRTWLGNQARAPATNSCCST